MKNFKLYVLLMAVLFVFTGCGIKGSISAGSHSGNSKVKSFAAKQTVKSPSSPVGTRPGDNGEQPGSGGSQPQKGGSLKDCDWTLKVSDTQEGSYDVMGKKVKASLTLDLVAWKDGGTDVSGEYAGEGYIRVDMDISGLTGLSGEEYSYAGGGAFNRKCEELQFTIEPYNSGKYMQSFPEMPGKAFVAPPGDFNAMSCFQSDWVTAVKDDTQVYYEGSQVFDGQRGYTDGQEDAMGINLLIGGAGVTVEIPTYAFAWNIAPFKGTITGVPAGTGTHEGLNMPEVGSGGANNGSGNGTGNNNRNGTGDENGTGSGTGGNEGMNGITGGGEGGTGGIGEGDGTGASGDPGDTPGGYLTDKSGKSGFDLNNDGKVDWYFDEEGNQYKDNNFDGKFEWFFYKDGTTGIDTNGDGKPDETYEGEFSD